MKYGKNFFLAFAVLAVLPINNVSAETFDYTVNVSQPEVAVQVISTVPDKDQELILDRTAPWIFLDTIQIKNTGGVATSVSANVSVSSSDGSEISLVNAAPANASQVQVFATVTGTKTAYVPAKTGLKATPINLMTTDPGTEKSFDLNAFVNKDFGSSIQVSATIDTKAI